MLVRCDEGPPCQRSDFTVTDESERWADIKVEREEVRARIFVHGASKNAKHTFVRTSIRGFGEDIRRPGPTKIEGELWLDRLPGRFC